MPVNRRQTIKSSCGSVAASSLKPLCTEHGNALKIQRFLNPLAPSQVLSPPQRGSSRRWLRGAYCSPGCSCGHAAVPPWSPMSPGQESRQCVPQPCGSHGLSPLSLLLLLPGNPGGNCSSDQALLPARLTATSLLYVHCFADVTGGGSKMPPGFLFYPIGETHCSLPKKAGSTQTYPPPARSGLWNDLGQKVFDSFSAPHLPSSLIFIF